MAPLRRWTRAVVSRIDHIVSQVENHEGLVDSAIQDVRRAAAQARVRLARVEKDGASLKRRLEDERESAKRWRERALETAASDEDRAVECLRRAKRAERLSEQLESRQIEHERSEKALRRDVALVEEKLAALREKRNVLRTRQSRAEALQGTRAAEISGDEVLGDLFDRWDTRITELELDGDCTSRVDALEAEYRESEEDGDLRAELASLRETSSKEAAK